MEPLESGRERDPGMKEPCRNPLQAPPRLAVSPTYRDKSHHAHKQQKADILLTD